MSTATAMNPMTDCQTYRSLRSACRGEMQAHHLYLKAAQRMEEASLYVIAHAFRFTAAQEKEHADIFRGMLIACGAPDDATAEELPFLLPSDPAGLLHAAIQAELDEGTQLYPCNAQLALAEGYPRIAEAFRRIAETELCHAQRFRQYAEALSDGTLFRDPAQTSWLCLPCGQFHTGREAPQRCTGCGRDRGHFIRSSFYPFSV